MIIQSLIIVLLRGGVGFCGLLTIVFVTLKLLGKIDWAWGWVLAPLWIPVAIAIIVIFVFLIVYLACNH